MNRALQGGLILGDAIVLYLALLVMLFIRYGTVAGRGAQSHFSPFTILFLIWILVFYIAGLYDVRSLKNNSSFARKLALALTTNFLFAIAFFYFVPGFGITPKTNLVIFLVLFSLGMYVWRTSYNTALLARGRGVRRILIVGYNQVAQELSDFIGENPQLGYEVAYWMKEGFSGTAREHLAALIRTHEVTTVAIPAHIEKRVPAIRLLAESVHRGVEVTDFISLYETLLHKVPLTEIENTWVLDHVVRERGLYDTVKRPLEVALALAFAVVLLPVAVLIILAIKLTSPGSAFFTQTRVGRYGTPFILWKFRTMVRDAEKDGAQWSQPGDRRVTSVGRVLRGTHLDELPQLANVISGDLSFVGPRPERPEFTKDLEREIPFYNLRHLVRPGITGWAQIHFRYGASFAEAYEKLQFDLYYLKHRSAWVDLATVLRTLKLLFVSAV